MSDAVSSPFDDIRRLITTMPGPDEAAVEAVRLRDGQLTKPAGSLGRLERIAEWLAAWQAKPTPSVDRPLVCVFAASHGISVIPWNHSPREITGMPLGNSVIIPNGYCSSARSEASGTTTRSSAQTESKSSSSARAVRSSSSLTVTLSRKLGR